MELITPLTRILSGGLFVLMMFLIFPIMEKFSRSHIGEKLPDTTLIYHTKDLYRWAEEYGASGRKWYIILRFTYDALFPLTYGFFLFTFVGFFSNSLNQDFFIIAYIPIIGMMLDYIENIVVSLIMYRYPKKTPLFDKLAPPISFIKRILVLFSFFLLLILAILYYTL